MILTSTLLLVGGLMLLVKGADYLVDGASSIARRFGVSTLVIGLTVVAFGTSAPELAVNVLSAFSGSADLALGNINGSNIANILLILGTTSLIASVPIRSRTVVKEIPFMVLAGVMLIVLMLDVALQGQAAMLTRTDGIVLLGFFAIFMYYLALSAKDTKGAATVEKVKRPLWQSSALTVAGLAGLVVGGQLTVTGATDIAVFFKVSEALIAVTLVAIGTSLPELVTAVVAARKGQTDLAIGGVVGSNIFNILFVLGTTATISSTPLVVSNMNIWDATVALAAMILLLFGIYLSRSTKVREVSVGLSRREGISFLLLYAAYIAYIVIRG